MIKTVLLIIAAVIPAIILMYYVWTKDKSKEPPKMLITLFLLGIASCIPAMFIELAVGSAINSIYPEGTLSNLFVTAYFGVALIEEGCKFVLMYLYTRNHKEFNGLFDGMIYATFVSLGFAAFENIFYVLENGFGNAVVRGIMSVPGHMFFAVFMGFYYSMWHTYRLCDKSETYFANLNMIHPRLPKYKYKGYLVTAIVLPTIVHGTFDFLLFINQTLACMGLVVVLYIVCFGRIKKMSKSDMENYQLIPMLLCRKYPELIGIITPRRANPMAMPAEYYQSRTGNIQNNTYNQYINH